MNTDKITVKEQSNGKFVVHVQLDTDNNLWLTNYEIAELFNVHISAINNNIRSIFKTKMLFEDQVSKQYSYCENNTEYVAILYNFEVLLFLAYRVDSLEVRAFREWILTTLRQKKKNIVCNYMNIHFPFGNERLN